MNKEEKITISVNEEDVQNIINAYEKDIEYINQLEKENQELKLELSGYRQAILGDKDMLGLKEENKKYKEVFDKANKLIYYNIKYRNGADIYQFVDIESEILEPLKYILEQDEENGNAYLKEFNDWLKEVE